MKSSRFSAVALAFLGALAGCGGGSSSGPPKPAPTYLASCAAQSGATQTGAIAYLAGSSPSLPNLGYCSSVLAIPSNNVITGSTNVQVTASLAAPAGVPTPAPGSGSNGLSSGLNPNSILWLTFLPLQPNLSITAPTAPTLSVSIYSLGTCSQFFAWTVPLGGAGSYTSGTLSGNTVSFGGQTNSPPTVSNGNYSTAVTCL